MKQYDGEQVYDTDYYQLGITTNKEPISFKNFSCVAHIQSYCKENNIQLMTLLFMGKVELDINKVPKKYRKYLS